MKLITETYDNVEMIVENTNSGKAHYISGRFMQGGRKGIREDMNANGRIYEEHVLDSAASRYINEYISKGRAFGELNHPPRPTIDPERVVVVIKELNKDGLHYNGKAQIVERSPLGQTIIGIMEAGGVIGVSTRALGTLKEENGIKYVQPDLRFSAVDVVSDPSGQGCFVNGILESVNYDLAEDGTIIQLAVDYTKKKINEEKAMKAFAELMSKFGSR
jgi:hypothetical protein